MNRRSKSIVIIAAILAALLILGMVGPLVFSSAGAAWYDMYGPGFQAPYVDPGHNGRYFENEYSATDAADMGRYHGVPVIHYMSAETAKDGNIKLTPSVRYRKALTYQWQAWSDNGTKQLSDDGWVNLPEATYETFRPADYLVNGNHMVRLTLGHAGSGAVVSSPVILSITDGAGENAGFSGTMEELNASAKNAGYSGAALVTDEGLARITIE